MTKAQLIQELSKFPDDMEIFFHCPDGYEDYVGAVIKYQENNCITLIGYLTCRDWFKKDFPNVKVYD